MKCCLRRRRTILPTRRLYHERRMQRPIRQTRRHVGDFPGGRLLRKDGSASLIASRQVHSEVCRMQFVVESEDADRGRRRGSILQERRTSFVVFIRRKRLYPNVRYMDRKRKILSVRPLARLAGPCKNSTPLRLVRARRARSGRKRGSIKLVDLYQSTPCSQTRPKREIETPSPASNTAHILSSSFQSSHCSLPVAQSR